jgi:hypothetical protein
MSETFDYFTLDSTLRRDQMIEGFQSFIWTERYNVSGDFQIVTPSTSVNKALLPAGTWLGMNQSKYIMVIDTVEDKEDDTGVRLLTITGKSLENLFADRVAMGIISDTTTNPSWVLTGAPDQVMMYAFQQICVETILDVHDTIPFYHDGQLLPPGNLPLPTDSITVTTSPTDLYTYMTQLASTYGIGFRLIRDGDSGNIYFEVYVGNDLTSDQTVLNPVIFDPNLDNLQGLDYLTSTAAVKTVAYVYAENGSAVVYNVNADPNAYGEGRRVLLVNSTNDADAGDDLQTALEQEGLIALGQQNQVYSFDGELPSTLPYTYGVDYNLGDMIEERDESGNANQMIVTEQIFSSDNTGDRSYPTLTLLETITPNTWASWDALQTWSDVDSSQVWATQ